MSSAGRQRRQQGREGQTANPLPRDALTLLYDPELLSWAANPWENAHWHHARSTTCGVDELTIARAFPDRAATKKWSSRALELLRLPLHELKQQAPKLKLSSVPKKDIWDPEYDALTTRDIFIPCILRRVISNHLSDILTATSRSVLSPAAKAYILGLRSPAAEIVFEVAKEFRQGRKFYVKLDISDCFNSLGWRSVQMALLAAGYPEHFISVLMAFLAVPALERRGRRLVEIPRYRGAPAGLPESGALLNILLSAIDDEILSSCRMLYRRYSDDLIIIGESREEVARGARMFCGWAWRNGLGMKGLKTHSDPARSVRNVDEVPLELLGVIIDRLGDLHIPQAKVDAHRAKLEHFGNLAADAPESVVGLSRYANGQIGRRGLQMADQDDLEAIIWGAHRYWSQFNQAEANALQAAGLSTVRNYTARPSDGPYRKIFTASLGRDFPPALRADGSGGSIHSSLTRWVDRFALPLLRECVAVGMVEGNAFSSSMYTGIDAAVGERLESEAGVSLSSVSKWSADEDSSSEVAPRLLDDGFDRMASPDLDEVDAGDLAIADHGRSPAQYRERSWVPAKVRVCFVAVERLGTDEVAVGVQEFVKGKLDLKPQKHKPFVRIFSGEEPMVAHLRMLIDRIKAPVSDEEALVIAGSSHLPKLLLDERRAIRRLGMTQLVEELHATQCPTVIIGPIAMPVDLRNRLRLHGRLNHTAARAPKPSERQQKR